MDAFAKMDIASKSVYIAGGVVAAAVIAFVVKKVLFSGPSEDSNPRDVVILRQIGRGPYAPSMSPFPLKLETYLRMAKIPYQSVHSFKMSSKGKTPWIQYNDDVVADSALCIEYLNSKFGIDLNRNLTKEERAVARAFEKMAEEGSIYWSLALYRWVYPGDRSLLKVLGISFFLLWSISRQVRKYAWAHGIGRHTQQEVDRMLEADLKAISDYLGDKKFMFGDKASEVDCALFGQLCEILYNLPGKKPETLVNKKFTNLVDYCERMKTLYWADWEDKITHGTSSGISYSTVKREEIYRP